MTVGELIEALGHLPQEAHVEVSGIFLNDSDTWEDVDFSTVRDIENHENYVDIIME